LRIQSLEVAEDKIERLSVIDGDKSFEHAPLATSDEMLNLLLPLF
jgi:hypothetical protein